MVMTLLMERFFTRSVLLRAPKHELELLLNVCEYSSRCDQHLRQPWDTERAPAGSTMYIDDIVLVPAAGVSQESWSKVKSSLSIQC